MPCMFAPPVHPGQGKLSSGYGTRPGRTTGKPRHHAGYDLVAPRGAPLYMVAPGVVERVVTDAEGAYGFNGYGNCIVVKTGTPDAPIWILYAHMDDHAGLEPGASIYAGDVVGYVGNSSNGKFPGMGVHCHFEVRESPKKHGWEREAPFPGPYGSFDIDPGPVLASMGVRIGRRGKIEVGGAMACVPKYQRIEEIA